MKKFICFFLFLSFAHAGPEDQATRIERDLNIMISQLQLLVEKDTEQLLLPMKSEDRDKFEEEILQMKIQLGKISRRFADQGRFPTGKKDKAKQ